MNEDICAEITLELRELLSHIKILQKAIQSDINYNEIIEIDDNLEIIKSKINHVMMIANNL